MTEYQQEQPRTDRRGAPSTAPNGLAVAALVCGIIGIVAAVLIALVGTIVGVLAVVFGVVSRRGGGRTTFATAGIITGAIAVVLGVANSIFGALLFSGQL